MTMREVNKMWKESMPNGVYDYWAAFESWTAFVDSLCKDGQIKDWQFQRATFPYKYGKNVKILHL